jgi:hypothetical protein
LLGSVNRRRDALVDNVEAAEEFAKSLEETVESVRNADNPNPERSYERASSTSSPIPGQRHPASTNGRSAGISRSRTIDSTSDLKTSTVEPPVAWDRVNEEIQKAREGIATDGSNGD